MRRLLQLALLLCVALPASATTKIYMKQMFNPLPSINTNQYASTLQSVLAVVTAVTNSAASGTNIPMTKTAGGSTVQWITPPVAVGFTTSTSANGFTANTWGLEDSGLCNCGMRVTVTDFTSSCSIIDTSFGTELTTSNTVQNWTGTQSACTVAIGDRLQVIWRVTNVGTMAGSHTVTMNYAGLTTGASGDTYVIMPDTISFQSEAEIIQTRTVQASTLAFLGAIGAGDTLAVATRCDGTATLTLGDGVNTYTQLTQQNFGAETQRAAYAQNVSSQAAPTVTPTGAGTFPYITIVDIAGVAAASFDVAARSNGASGTAMDSGSVSTTAANEILLGIAGTQAGSQTWTAGNDGNSHNYLLGVTASGSALEALSITATESAKATMTFSVNTAWGIDFISFKWGTQPVAATLHSRALIGTGI